MKSISIIIFFVVLLSCNNKTANQEIVYDLQKGYEAFLEDTTSHNDSLAKEQALYLAQNYGDDGITEHALGIKQWLKSRGIDYDSVHKKGNARYRRPLQLKLFT